MTEPGESGGPAAGRTEPETAPRSANQYRTEPIPPAPGHADAAPSGDASTGSTSEDSSASGLIREPVLDAADGRTAIAVPGKPDGEVDTRT